MRKRKTLTQKQRLAVHHYVVNGTMADAYRHAYQADRMSANTVRVKAWELFRRPHVAAYVCELKERARDADVISRQEALLILSRIARGKISAYLDGQGRIDPKAAKQRGGPDLEGLSWDDDGKGRVRRRLRMRNPLQAIDLIGKICGWNRDHGLEGASTAIHLNFGGGKSIGT